MENMVHYYSSTNRDFLFYLSNILIINHLTLKLYKLFNYLINKPFKSFWNYKFNNKIIDVSKNTEKYYENLTFLIK